MRAFFGAPRDSGEGGMSARRALLVWMRAVLVWRSRRDMVAVVVFAAVVVAVAVIGIDFELRSRR